MHTYTVATVAAALGAASRLGFDVGTAEQRVRTAIQTHFVDASAAMFARGNKPNGDLDPVPDSSLLLLPLLDPQWLELPEMRRTVDHLEAQLWTLGQTGGMARYAGDYYFRRSDDHPGNPWIICTAWLGQVRALQGNLDGATRILKWIEGQAETTGVLPEQVHPDTGEHLSVSPLAWSQAEALELAKLVRSTG